jgi:dihydrofolate synthase / folylpolyglutamate synthase
MTYQETLDYLFTKLPMFSRIGAAAYKKDLTNTLALLEILGHPQKKLKCIHIAGTNGKGSTSHMLAAVLQTAGYKTGLYTSPHLKDFRERIRINGSMIEERFVTDFVEHIQPAINKIQPSFFEITVAMAFAYFAVEEIDVAVVEVGLGGRLDSTNVIIPLLSIITNIGRDHMNLLGDSLEKIAFEKAGIIKEKIPVVVGETKADTLPVFVKKAAAMQAPLFLATEEFYVDDWEQKNRELAVSVVQNSNNEHRHYHLDLPGIYQTRNLLTVLTAIRQLREQGWQIAEGHIQEALKKVKKLTGLHGRWETIHQHPLVVADVGHNEDGIRQIADQLSFTAYEHLHIVVGMVKDKEVEKVLQLLPSLATYYFTKAQIPRALPEEQLQALALPLGKKGHHYPDVNTALKAALTSAKKEDMILVCGSVFIVGEITLF